MIPSFPRVTIDPLCWRYLTSLCHPVRRTTRCYAWTVAALLAASTVGASTVAADDLPLSASVKLLPSGNDDAGESAMQNVAIPQTPPPQPTLPGGKLPQYQLGHQQKAIASESERNNPRLRLILALPTEPVLIEATITIDGIPFRMVRERRIQDILENESTVVEIELEIEVESGAAPTVAPYSLATTGAERLRRYVDATGEAASPDEVRWLLTHWVDGPTLLLLNDNFQRFRANQRPVFDLLDRNCDSVIANDEVLVAVKSLNECDLNHNDIVEYTEIAKVADDPRRNTSQHAGPGKLIFRVPDEAAASAVYQRIAARYELAKKHEAAESEPSPILPRFDPNRNGRFDPEELTALREAEPDLRFTVAFDSKNPADSRLELTAANAVFVSAAQSGTARESAISLPLGGTTVTFSAVQSGSSDQISIGAVNDGYPILPVIDPNQDGRFTIRELRTLVDRLITFDSNHDGNLSSDETRATIRICFGLGPHVHRELGKLRRMQSTPTDSADSGPEWFVRMDRNQDNDLTPSEFPGTDEQFKLLDTDSDDLISAQEANDSSP